MGVLCVSASDTRHALRQVTPFLCYICIAAGLWGGCAIGFLTEYYTSHSYQPVRDVARSAETGAATNIIYGLALGYQSVIAPVIIISFIIFISFKFAGMYGVALAALGMLSTLSTCLAIDVYGPISDNAGGIAEMCEMPSSVRDKTDALDAAGALPLSLLSLFRSRTLTLNNPRLTLNTQDTLLAPWSEDVR